MGAMQYVRAEKGKVLVDRGLGHVWFGVWHLGIVWVCLGFTYFVKTEIFLLKVL